MDIEEEIIPWIGGLGAVLGIVGCEYLYFSNADEVRLLYVILLIPVGAILGAIATILIAYSVVALLGLSVVAAVVALVLAVVGGIVYLLHSIVVWRN